MPTAAGSFEVKLTPQTPTEDEEPLVGRLRIDKTFAGDLAAESKGQMLAYRSDADGSAGYVAMERVVGALAGREGAFVLQHIGKIDRGTPSLVITVVPDSGTGGLTGIRGTMVIQIAEGKHSYIFEYAL